VVASCFNPPLSVAVPTCNGAAHLREALESIIAQDGVDFELIVADDGSDDETLEIVRATAGDRPRIDAHGERLGLGGNWNRCAELCHTPLLAIFHQDDVMKPGHLQAHVAAFATDETLGLVASASDVIDEHGVAVSPAVIEHAGLGPVDRRFEPGGLAPSMSLGNPLRCSAVTMRLAAFHDAGGFDASYRYVVDWDFWLRVSRRWGVGWLATPTVRVRWHRASETHRFKTATADLDETSRLLEELFAVDLKDRANAARLRRGADRRLARAFLNRAYDALHAGYPHVARDCLGQAVRRSPRVITTMLGDPRLSVQMAVLAVAPRIAGRWFNASPSDPEDRRA
jgi:glycosyltransferase involved in cell wall biosynthesis